MRRNREPVNEEPRSRRHRDTGGTEEFDYESDLAIDPNFLDAEFLNHSQTFMKYAKESAKANKAAKLAEQNVKVIRSELIEEAKRKGQDKNAATLEAYYRNDDRHKKAKADWIEATFYADLIQNAVFAFQARKLALENLVRLHGQEYFSRPQEPRDLPESVKALAEIKKSSSQNKIKDRMNGRRGA